MDVNDSRSGSVVLDPVDVRLPTPTSSEFRAPSIISLEDLDNSDGRVPVSSAPKEDVGATLISPATISGPSATSAIASSEGIDITGEPLYLVRGGGEFGQEINRGRSRSRESTRSRRSRQRSPSAGDAGQNILPLAVRELTPRTPRTSRHRRTVSFSRSRSSSPSPSLRLRMHPPPPRRDRPRPPITARIRQILGIATPRASLVWRLSFNVTQISVICALLGLASRPGSAHPIPREIDGLARVFGKSQWETCQRPLGAWDVVWAVKAAIGMAVSVWEYRRAVRPSLDQLLSAEQEQSRDDARRTRRTRRHRPSGSGDSQDPGHLRRNSSPIVWTRGDARESDLDRMDATARGTSRPVRVVGRMNEIRTRRAREERWYSRCASFQALYGLIWFVTANILLYGSLETCRYTSPYIWWLTFGLVCLGYIVVAEMLAMALVVFVLGPLLYVTINIILVCLGRHPMQPGGRMGHINPDIPKMPRALVDRIPLVMYIPVPVREEPKAQLESESPLNAIDGIEVEHTYPPVPLASPPPAKLKPDPSAPPPAPSTPPRVRRRFFFFRRKKAVPVVSKEDGAAKGGEDVDLEAGWERNEYPFVKLEANRAACAICLMDFEPPKRIGAKGKERDDGKEGEQEKVETNTGGTGEAEPLRLLACGHVFHRECLDPWLVDVSGRCPTCQRPVEEEDLEPEEGSDKKKKKPRRT
ncbi:hypothetical protein FRC12_008909 [Ceratobasidium sp. 428]|nr:hypothetical protein FRC12_008909 [Ceratobasidium sp. 428]